MMRRTIQELASAEIRFRLFDDASAEIVDLARDRVWTMGPVALQERRRVDDDVAWLQAIRSTSRPQTDVYAGRFRAEMEGDTARITLYAPFVGSRGCLRARYSVDGPVLTVEIPWIDEEIPCLTFPGPLEADAAVIPNPQGKPQLIREAGSTVPSDHSIEWKRIMPFWGGLLDDGTDDRPDDRADDNVGRAGLPGGNGWIAIMEQGEPYCHVLRRYAKTAPLWIKSLDSWDYPRRISYRFVDGGYTEMAKVFRGWAKAHGMYKSLAEKIEERPRLAGYIGGRNVRFMMARPFSRAEYESRWLDVPAAYAKTPEGLEVDFTFNQAAQVVEDCKKLGMKRGGFKFDGWGKGGYDARHPDIWPPDPALGTIDEFKRLLAQPDPYTTWLHDNYSDVYEASPGFPNGAVRDRDNEPVPGGIWAGGPCCRTNSRDAYHWAVRNLELTKELGMTGAYFDTLAGHLPEESFEPGNRLTREEAIRYRIELLKHYQDAGFLTSTTARAWDIPYIDRAPINLSGKGVGATTPPLFSLVYHDTFLGSVHLNAPGPNGEFTPAMKRRCLEMMLWGWGVNIGGFTRETWPRWRKTFSETLFVDEWHEKVALAEMTDHAYLTSDGLVERTEWSSGQAITVNLSEETVEIGTKRIGPLDYSIVE